MRAIISILAMLLAAAGFSALDAAERHEQPRYATIERFGIRVKLPPHAVLCGGAPLSATRELYILTVEGSRCDVRTPADIDVLLRADFNMSLEVYELPPIRRVIARHACQRTRISRCWNSARRHFASHTINNVPSPARGEGDPVGGVSAKARARTPVWPRPRSATELRKSPAYSSSAASLCRCARRQHAAGRFLPRATPAAL